MDNVNLLNRKEIKANLKPCPFCGIKLGKPRITKQGIAGEEN